MKTIKEIKKYLNENHMIASVNDLYKLANSKDNETRIRAQRALSAGRAKGKATTKAFWNEVLAIYSETSNQAQTEAVEENNQAEKEIALYRKELGKYFNLNSLHEAKIYNKLCEMVEKDVNNGEKLSLKLVNSYHAPEDYKFVLHDAYMDYKALKQA